ncbi:ras GEF [Rickenella mellea]|uniref:Ras GEF n=1 Tax=Rickenella mellea TaxID=50990 RepID=A0A4Y7QFI8_9AGAM|nr:ras GEF [Rickenella mellea]
MSASSRSPPTSHPNWRISFVLCLYDFKSADPDHLPFKKNEILEIVKQEDSGWWAALRDDKIGWVPSAFLAQLTDDMADILRGMPEELRVPEYDAEVLYNSAPVSNLAQPFNGAISPDTPNARMDDWLSVDELGGKAQYIQVNPPSYLSGRNYPDDVPHFSALSPQSPPHSDGQDAYSIISETSELSPAHSTTQLWQARPCPPSPSTPMPQPQTQPQSLPTTSNSNSRPNLKISPLMINKPTPPTPAVKNPPTPASPAKRPLLSRSRSDSAPSLLANNRLSRRRPIMLDDHSSLSNLSSYIDSDSPTAAQLTTPDLYKSFESPEGLRSPSSVLKSPSSLKSHRSDKVKQLTGDDDAQAFHNAKLAQASLPWYLRPSYSAEDIKLEYDGGVRAGTLTALIERLTVDPLTFSQETALRHVFLTTFRTFATADEVFDIFIERYQMDHPPQLTTEEFQEWKEKKLRRVQKRVLSIFSMWIEEHHMLRDDPQIVPRLRDFLVLVISPPSLALTSKLMLQELDRRVNGQIQSNPSGAATSNKKRKPKPVKTNDLLRMDVLDLAQQLTLYEHRLYSEIRAPECLMWPKTQKGDSVANLVAFCATHDKLAAWVKMSVLANDGLGKRADSIDFWIRIAEKCRVMNNLSSLSAISAALSSTVLARLHLTWAHVGRSSHLEPLTKLNEPTSNFTAYRTLYQSIEGPCVPFIGMFLSDLLHVQDSLKDTVTFPTAGTPPTASAASASSSSLNLASPGASSISSTTSGGSTSTGPPLINFTKRHKLYDAVHAILRHQSKPYAAVIENPQTLGFIEMQLGIAAGKDPAAFWTRSQDLQLNEVAQADIRKGLEAAGF